MFGKTCKHCGGDNEVAKIARAMGLRPDIAFRRIAQLERFIRNGVELGYIVVPDDGDPARKIIDEILNA